MKDNLRKRAEVAKVLYALGEISREEAFQRVRPYVDLVNETSKKLSRKFGVTHKEISVIGYLR